MTDSPPSPGPQVRVTLPDGRRVTGRLLRWRQDQAGVWWAEATVYVPARAVHPVDGEDYSAVERQPAEPRYVLSVDTRLKPPQAVLHLTTCWTLDKPGSGTRITPMPDASKARGMLRFADTAACEACKPAP